MSLIGARQQSPLRELARHEHPDAVGAAAGANIVPLMVAAHRHSHLRAVEVWDLVTRRSLMRFHFRVSWEDPLAFSPDGKTLVGGDIDGKVYFWNLASGNLIATLPAHTAACRAISFSPDGRALGTAEVVDTRSPASMRKAVIGLLTLVTVPPAAVFDGATSLGTTPLQKLPLQVGTYRLRIVDSEGNSRLFSAPVELAKEKKYTIRLSDLPPYGE